MEEKGPAAKGSFLGCFPRKLNFNFTRHRPLVPTHGKDLEYFKQSITQELQPAEQVTRDKALRQQRRDDPHKQQLRRKMFGREL